MTRMTHAERRDRRERIAQAIKRGWSPAVVCQKYGVTLKTVRDSCRECGVKFPAPTKG